MGDLKLNGSTSGTITVTPTAVAGTNTITLPASTGTVALTASPTFSGTTTVTTITATTITSPSATALTLQYGGTTGATLDTSGNLQFNSGYGSVAKAYACRAWVSFAPSGTIRGSANVSSITVTGTGDYRVNFTTAMPDANFSAVATCSHHAGITRAVDFTVEGYATTYVSVVSGSTAGVYSADYNNVVIFR